MRCEMADHLNTENTRRLMDDLRKIEIFSDLPEESLGWLAEKFKEVQLRPGEVFIQAGDPAESLFVILDGEIRFQISGGPDSPVYRVNAGNVTGFLPYSRMTQYRGTGQAGRPTRGLILHKDFFPEMLQRIPQLGQRFVGLLADRIREMTRVDEQRDKLAALGKLSAGLAHELNNPAAAAKRSALALSEAQDSLREAISRLDRSDLTSEQRSCLLHFERQAMQRVQAPVIIDSLTQSEQEEEIATWLNQHHIADAWKLAAGLAEAGLDVPWLEGLQEKIGDAILNDALTRVLASVLTKKLTREIESSTGRIAELVKAIKEYSFMDQAPIQEIDIHDGIEST